MEKGIHVVTLSQKERVRKGLGTQQFHFFALHRFNEDKCLYKEQI
jgi:hypothetical protein